jgi:hypothetical protein
MSLAEVQSKMSAAIAARVAGDYHEALALAVDAQGLLACIPDQGKGTERLGWSIDRIQNFIVNLRRLASSAAAALSGGIQRQRVTYTRPGDDPALYV